MEELALGRTMDSSPMVARGNGRGEWVDVAVEVCGRCLLTASIFSMEMEAKSSAESEDGGGVI